MLETAADVWYKQEETGPLENNPFHQCSLFQGLSLAHTSIVRDVSLPVTGIFPPKRGRMRYVD